MADRVQIEVLSKGVAEWNAWRRAQTRGLKVDLEDTDLQECDLQGAWLRGANLCKANLGGANLRLTNLEGANLRLADLRGAGLIHVSLLGANLQRADMRLVHLNYAHLGFTKLQGANLRDAFLQRANMHRANLMDADLEEASLMETILTDVDLERANFAKAMMGGTVLASNNLSLALGLDEMVHFAPSFVDVDTLIKYEGLPTSFLQGIGLPNMFIEYLPSLTGAAFQFFESFISYSHADIGFARRLHDRLQDDGIRCWRDERALKPGDRFWKSIHDSLKLKDKVILILSESSLESWWVKDELEKTFARERSEGVDLLVPITLDKAIFTWDHHYRSQIMERNIGDFIKWTTHEEFEQGYEKLRDALRT